MMAEHRPPRGRRREAQRFASGRESPH
jgi:hypothetical protein